MIDYWLIENEMKEKISRKLSRNPGEGDLLMRHNEDKEMKWNENLKRMKLQDIKKNNYWRENSKWLMN